jgi:hypothetical protein
MPLTASDVRASIERAGPAHWQALVDHHEQAYPRPCPTPGAICHFEAERLNALGWGDARGPLLESRVRRVGSAVEIIHGFQHADSSVPEWTPAFRNYEPDPEPA